MNHPQISPLFKPLAKPPPNASGLYIVVVAPSLEPELKIRSNAVTRGPVTGCVEAMPHGRGDGMISMKEEAFKRRRRGHEGKDKRGEAGQSSKRKHGRLAPTDVHLGFRSKTPKPFSIHNSRTRGPGFLAP